MEEDKSPLERLRLALANREEEKRREVQQREQTAQQSAEMAELYKQLETLPKQERRRMLRQAGIKLTTEAPPPITPLRGSGRSLFSAPTRSAASQSCPADTGTEVSRYGSPDDALAYERRITEAADAILQEQADYALLVGGAPMIAAVLGGVPAISISTAPAARPSAVPVQRSAAQDAKILETLRGRGYDPKDLPVPARGKAGVKAEIRKALAAEPLFFGTKVFDKAWQRMRENDDIADGT